jgi:hypothetical protein
MRWICLIFLIPLCAPIPALGAGHDYPGVGHIQGYHIGPSEYRERRFDRASVEAEAGQKIPVEGHTIQFRYDADDYSNHGSNLEVYLNFEEILKSLKAEILHSPANMGDNYEHILARFYRNGEPIYVNIHAYNDGQLYDLFIVEQKEFKPSIVTPPDK